MVLAMTQVDNERHQCSVITAKILRIAVLKEGKYEIIINS